MGLAISELHIVEKLTHLKFSLIRLHTDSFYLYVRNDSSIQWKNKKLEEHPSLKQSIKRLHPPFKVADQYLVFSKKFNTTNPKLAQTIWKSIEKARNSEEYHREERALLVH
jgi:hypothetical protein